MLLSLMELFSFTLLLHRTCFHSSHLGSPRSFQLDLFNSLPMCISSLTAADAAFISPQCPSLGLLNSLLIYLPAPSLAPPMHSPCLSQINPLEIQIWSWYLLSKTFQSLLWHQVPLVRIKSRALMIRLLQNGQPPFW